MINSKVLINCNFKQLYAKTSNYLFTIAYILNKSLDHYTLPIIYWLISLNLISEKIIKYH